MCSSMEAVVAHQIAGGIELQVEDILAGDTVAAVREVQGAAVVNTLVAERSLVGVDNLVVVGVDSCVPAEESNLVVAGGKLVVEDTAAEVLGIPAADRIPVQPQQRSYSMEMSPVAENSPSEVKEGERRQREGPRERNVWHHPSVEEWEGSWREVWGEKGREGRDLYWGGPEGEDKRWASSSSISPCGTIPRRRKNISSLPS